MYTATRLSANAPASLSGNLSRLAGAFRVASFAIAARAAIVVRLPESGS